MFPATIGPGECTWTLTWLGDGGEASTGNRCSAFWTMVKSGIALHRSKEGGDQGAAGSALCAAICPPTPLYLSS